MSRNTGFTLAKRFVKALWFLAQLHWDLLLSHRRDAKQEASPYSKLWVTLTTPTSWHDAECDLWQLMLRVKSSAVLYHHKLFKYSEHFVARAKLPLCLCLHICLEESWTFLAPCKVSFTRIRVFQFCIRFYLEILKCSGKGPVLSHLTSFNILFILFARQLKQNKTKNYRTEYNKAWDSYLLHNWR